MSPNPVADEVETEIHVDDERVLVVGTKSARIGWAYSLDVHVAGATVVRSDRSLRSVLAEQATVFSR